MAGNIGTYTVKGIELAFSLHGLCLTGVFHLQPFERLQPICPEDGSPDYYISTSDGIWFHGRSHTKHVYLQRRVVVASGARVSGR